jgi:hypothetical protein
MDNTFEEVYDKIVEKLRGNLNNKEYRELITLEYVVTQGYDEKGDVEKYMELSKKKHK